ncbi:hypothetical protein MUO32_26160 [Shinella sp. CPCC 101442]|jgi:hypothetical protein|uniref:hypothetical protein n=1 Tax=Shinella sp. CPCC 101442 TaxID=2932265 RepID=UPI00215220E6|nr:hypothetical protein [Shinella sp. CPCC 101442]MCR6502516.1 hypothetical protein [Shinella sp. CPCC 101442]
MEEELDVLVLSLEAIEAYDGFSPRQREQIMPYVRGLATYKATRPGAALETNVIDLEQHTIRRKLEAAIKTSRKSALADGLRVHQAYAYSVNEFGDVEYPDID